MIRIALIDDQAMIRQGLRLILDREPTFTVVGEATDGDEALDLCRRSSPDVVLMDVRMPRVDGIEACSRVRAEADPPHVLMLTTFQTDDYVYEALRAGASGFLLKDAPAEQLVDAIAAVARGDAILAPQVTRFVIDQVSRRTPLIAQRPAWLDDLTEREHDVLVHMAQGESNTEIAAALFLGEATVKTHVGRVFAKLGVRDRVQAVIAAYEAGVVWAGRGSPEERST